MIGYNLRRATLLACIACAVVFSACEKSPAESVPEAGEISGTITFTGDAPSAGSIFISIQTDWPPRGAPYTALPITVSASTFDYEFEDVPFGTYGAITVSWEDPNDQNPATNQHVLGAYGGSLQSGFMDATSVTLSEDDHELEDADFTADFSLVQPS